MKKLLALLLAAAMLLCSAIAVAEEEIPDTMTAENGQYVVAMVTDVGQLKDQSFNEGTWNGVKGYAAANGLSYKYYQPANGDKATDEDRYDAIKAACDAGAKVVVGPGFMQAGAMGRAAEEYPDVKFVFIDGFPLTDSKGEVLTNVAPIAFKEEQAGYFAGYAAVAEGFTKLGFSGGGGGDNPAVNRYGWGFIQGANDAAAKLGVTVDMRYTYAFGASFSPSADLQTLISGWYEAGTEVVFSCGGSIFDSITAAASANDGCVIGVDVDQSYKSDTVVTSAMKGITAATKWAIAKVFDEEGTKWTEIGGTPVSLGVENDAVGLPVDTWSLEKYTVEEYQQLFADMLAGTVVVNGEAPNGDPGTDWTNVKLEYVE